MAAILIMLSAIIIACVFLNNLSSRLGVPALLLFLVLGLVFHVSGDVSADKVNGIVENVCTAALIFIMFYGGFGTRWSSAKPIALDAGLLATFGVAATAALVGLFCRFALHWGWIESFLMGSVISSTDAASVFSILRRRKLGLKGGTASLLEVESGSNDPMSYMLTSMMLTMLKTKVTAGWVLWTIFSQLAFGTICGLVIAQIAVHVLRRFNFADGFTTLFIFAVAILSYAVPSAIGGNGYLSAYFVGIVLGNTEFRGRKPLVNFFDGITSLMQILIFFLLGLIANPSALGPAVLPAVLIFLFLTFIARPVAVGGILGPAGRFKKYSLPQIGFISFVGLRGAASIVFAIMILTSGAALQNDIFSIVFCIVLISIGLQGSLIPQAARLFNVLDSSSDVMKTFSDFGKDVDVSIGRIFISSKSKWKGLAIKDLNIPEEFLLTLILRDGKRIVPEGNTVLQEGDEVVFCTKSYRNETATDLTEHPLASNSQWDGKRVLDFQKGRNSLIVMIRRGDESIIPNGRTVLRSGDLLVLMKR